MKTLRFPVTAAILCAVSALAEDASLREQAIAAMRRAATFYSTKVATHGGYVYCCSPDLSVGIGEGKATAEQIWVQPPGASASWTAVSKENGTFPLVLPVGSAFQVMLPRDGTNEGPKSKAQIIGDIGGATDEKVKRIEGELLIRLDGDKVEAHFRDLKATHGPTRPAPDAGENGAAQKQERLRAIALESVAQAVRTGDLYILHEPGITPRERTHDPETGYPILVLPVGDPEASRLFNEAMRAYFRDQKSAKEEAK